MFKRVSDWLLKIEEVVALGVVGLMAGVIATQVVSRYGLDRPLSWPEELSEFLFITLTFIGATAVLKRGGHFSMDALVQSLPEGARTFIHRASMVLMGVLAAALAWYSISMGMVYAGTRSVVLGIPEEIKAWVMAYAFSSMAVFCVSEVLSGVRPERTGIH